MENSNTTINTTQEINTTQDLINSIKGFDKATDSHKTSLATIAINSYTEIIKDFTDLSKLLDFIKDLGIANDSCKKTLAIAII